MYDANGAYKDAKQHALRQDIFKSDGCIELQCRLYRPNNNHIITKLKQS